MIKSIQLHKLFGRFNYNISMKSGGVTIITGPNGFGKSTILRIINALNSGVAVDNTRARFFGLLS